MISFTQFIKESIDDHHFIDLVQRVVNSTIQSVSNERYTHADHVCQVTFVVRDINKLENDGFMLTSTDKVSSNCLNNFVMILRKTINGKHPEIHNSRFNTYVIEFNNPSTSYNKCLITERDYHSRVEFIVEFCDDYGYSVTA